MFRPTDSLPKNPCELIQEYHTKIPPSICFTAKNLRKYKDTPYAQVFTQVHLGFYAFAIMMCYPSILRRAAEPSEYERLDVACEVRVPISLHISLLFGHPSLMSLLLSVGREDDLSLASCSGRRCHALCGRCTILRHDFPLRNMRPPKGLSVVPPSPGIIRDLRSRVPYSAHEHPCSHIDPESIRRVGILDRRLASLHLVQFFRLLHVTMGG